MTIQAAAQNKPVVVLNPGLKFTEDGGGLSKTGRLALQQIHSYVVGTNRIIPCNATIDTNVVTLTMLNIQPLVTQYTSYDTFRATAPAASTGALTAAVVSASGALATLKVYTQAGVQAGNGAIVQDVLYDFTYNDALDGGDGGFILLGPSSFTALTDSSGGVVSDTIGPVTGTGDDTNINNNFASLTAKIDALISLLTA